MKTLVRLSAIAAAALLTGCTSTFVSPVEVTRFIGDQPQALGMGPIAVRAGPGAQQDSLKGIGDKAFFGPRDRLYFRKGDAFVAVEGGFDEHARERALSVARAVAGKL